MKLSNWKSVGAALALAFGFSLPASAQLTYNFSDSGNCNFPPATCTVTGSGTVAKDLTLTGWSAASGANFVSAAITDQSGSGVGMNSDGSTAPNHAIDNNGRLELMMLNFNNNKVVLNSWNTGWSYNDTDVSLLRWVGAATGPNMLTTADFTNKSSADLLAMGWALVKNVDMDGNQTNTNSNATYGGLSATSGLAVNASNSSSWWIISSYFQGGSTAPFNNGDDYFKLLSVNATCVSNTAGGACNTVPPGAPEPGSLALAGVALLGLYGSRRRILRSTK